jgi:hypothetical protein
MNDLAATSLGADFTGLGPGNGLVSREEPSNPMRIVVSSESASPPQYGGKIAQPRKFGNSMIVRA